MNRTTFTQIAVLTLAAVAAAPPASAQTPLGSEWTYQGRITDGGAPVNGTLDFRFRLWDADAGGSSSPSQFAQDVDVVDGLFTVELDFGTSPFAGDARWLEIAVRDGALSDPAPYSTLSPRQPLTAAPYAQTALSALSAESVPGVDGHSLDAVDGAPVDAVFVDNAGKVGIGTTTPVDKLTISQGDLRVDRGAQTSNQQAILTLNGARTSGTNPFASIDFSNYDSDSSAIDYTGARILSLNADGDADSGDLRFYTKGAADANALNRMRITPAGNVGINSSAPAAKLEVRRASGETEVARFADPTGASQLRFQATSTRGEIQGWNGNADLPGNLILNQDGGNVGIGTNAPNALVHIKHSGDFYTPLRYETAGISGPALSLNHTGTGGKEWLVLSQGSFNGTAGNFSIRNESDGFDPITITPSGFIGIGTSAPATTLDVAGEITGLAINLTSDRNAKEDFKPVNARDVLDKVARMPITEWQYKAQSEIRHIGPMAQDFRDAFALGHDDRHITSVDADGVALAAIQGLNQKLDEQVDAKDAEIRRLRSENQALAERLAVIERALGMGVESAE